MHALSTAGAGFLIAVLWFDLMFDVQVLPHRHSAVLPGETLDSIARYYRRVTIDASPMGRLVSAGMLGLLVGLVTGLVRGEHVAVDAVTVALAVSAIGLAGARIVPDAKRLGRRTDDIEGQTRLARRICTGHLYCITAMAAVLSLQLVRGG